MAAMYRDAFQIRVGCSESVAHTVRVGGRRCWALDRDTFRKIMMSSGKQSMNERTKFLAQVSYSQRTPLAHVHSAPERTEPPYPVGTPAAHSAS